MSASKAKRLSSLLRTLVRPNTETEPYSTASTTTTPVRDRSLKKFVPAIGTVKSSAVNSSKPNSSSSSAEKPAADHSLATLELETDSDTGNPRKYLSEDIYTILKADTSVSSPDSEETDNDNVVENVVEIPWFSTMADNYNVVEDVVEIPWFSTMTLNNVSVHREEVLHERRQKWIFKGTQGNRFNRLVQMCASKLGTEATVQVLGRLGREIGLKEYNALIGICVEKAKASDDEDVALEQISKASQLFKFMKEQGFELEEETYGKLLMYLIDMGMVEEFHFFCKAIQDGNSCSVPRLGYYEMLLWIRVNDEQKIQELCNSIAANDEGDYSNLQENYLLALCETDRKDYLLQTIIGVLCREVLFGIQSNRFMWSMTVVLDKGMSIKCQSEIKGTLVIALALHGQMSDALSIFEEIKQAGCDIEPKVVISLIEHLRSEVELSVLIQLLEELHDDHWIEGCCRLFVHSVRFKNLSFAIDLFRQLKDKLYNDELAIERVLHEAFAQIAETEPMHVQFGLDLLQVIKDKRLQIIVEDRTER
ncbi:hypothetical protein ACOSQ3_031060 [Xanthoceras sorbifolium]